MHFANELAGGSGLSHHAGIRSDICKEFRRKQMPTMGYAASSRAKLTLHGEPLRSHDFHYWKDRLRSQESSGSEDAPALHRQQKVVCALSGENFVTSTAS